MTYRHLTDLADIARSAGLTVVEHPGWRTRGRPKSTGNFDPSGVLVHHTATGKAVTDAAVAQLLIKGRTDLPGPLSHYGLTRTGVVHVIAAGRANHAGEAKASGPMHPGDGNALYVGIEAYNDGRGEPWPPAQYDAYVRLVAALCRRYKWPAVNVRGHKETSVTGKVDPTFDMVKFRTHVAAQIARDAKPPAAAPPTSTPAERAAQIITDRAKTVKRPKVRELLATAARRLRTGR